MAHRVDCDISLGHLLRRSRDRLRASANGTPDLDARLLLLAATGVSHEAFIADPDRIVSQEDIERLEGLIDRRLAGEPVSRILGAREFYGRKFALSAATLDPRPDTETLIDQCLAIVDVMGWRDKSLRLLDVGTGSGAIIITLLAELPHASGVATDLEFDALMMARANAERLGVGERLSLVQCNWMDTLSCRMDVILSNPPYIPTNDIATLSPEVRCHDPLLALDGGLDGLDAYRHLVPSARDLLNPGGWVLLETGDGQADAVSELCGLCGFSAHPEVAPQARDLAGLVRVVSMQLA
ncbi:peptide chain release factor N(5)-glutamine methyltransferase [Rhodoligotrophos appendicifer]|uniref:peptide chain release factor N(5)-glutamine methyltransferase n=1 Tax=Rhodoligotrophos appendicifer TaxID=987056 RepID=UPI001FE4E85F|nr:peptide chain release factor N(5)-glutamine methyltransferase [Rhodoligotrophos appendicifer]